jgi:predicted enzyme related to lactoylglutathione lyase
MTKQADSGAESSADAKDETAFGHGRLSYMQVPAVDVRASSEFYSRVFGWVVRGGTDHHLGFTDATGDMIGAWVTGRAISREPGILPYLSVKSVDAILERVVAAGGEVVTPPYPEGALRVATFRDPAGNVMGVWQQARP